MPFIIDEKTGHITLVQGDSDNICITGLPTDKNYSVYFSFYNESRKIIGEEMKIESNGSSIAQIHIKSSLTDLLTVPKDEETAEYYYGIKLCHAESGYEDTLIIGDKEIGELNIVTVYPKQTEGIIT